MKNHINQKFLDLIREIMEVGFVYEDPNRKGVYRKQIDKHILEHKFEDGFPIITTKKSFPHLARLELELFMSGETDIRVYQDRGLNFWTKDWQRFVDKHDLTGEDKYLMKNIYPTYLPKQIDKLLNTLREKPMTTKKIVTHWFPEDHGYTTLTPCHTSFEAIVRPLEEKEKKIMIGADEDGRYTVNRGKQKYGLTIRWNQGSVDTFLGLPLNIMYYSYLCTWLAEMAGMKDLGVEGVLSNVHLYDNAWETTNKLLSEQVNLDNWNKDQVFYLARDKNETFPKVENFETIMEGDRGKYLPVPMLTYSD